MRFVFAGGFFCPATISNLLSPSIFARAQLKLLRFSEEDESLSCVASFGHKHEVLSLAACPTAPSLAATVYNDVATQRGAVWRMPPVSFSGGTSSSLEPAAADLELIAQLPSSIDEEDKNASRAGLECVAWAASGQPRLVSASRSSIREVTIREGGGSSSSLSRSLETGPSVGLSTFRGVSASNVGAIAWDPHHANEVAAAVDGSVLCFDLRLCERTHVVERAVLGDDGAGAGLCVRALSYNPNKPWFIATGGDDFRVRCWDLRKANGGPVKTLEGHSHWVTGVAYNPFHDQLLLSCGSDAQTNLWRVSSISSAPLLELDEAEGGEVSGAGEGASGDGQSAPGTSELQPARHRAEPRLAADAALRVQRDNGESVCAIAWSMRTAWVYASLSYDGKVIVSQVPSAEKYKILL